jgi:hypothetical protein
MAKNSVLLGKGSGQAFLAEAFRQFCRAQKCLSTHKKCAGIFFKSAEMGLLKTANLRVLIILFEIFRF